MNMNKETKDYISSLNRDCLPWHRMITAYGTAEKYNDLIEMFEESDAIPDDLFYSFYYYSKLVLLQVPEILEESGEFIAESNLLKTKL